MTRAETDPHGLAAALEARGYPCMVESRERLAVLAPSGPWPALDDAAARRAVHVLAAQFGFTHVALELVDDGATATSSPAAARG